MNFCNAINVIYWIISINSIYELLIFERYHQKVSKEGRDELSSKQMSEDLSSFLDERFWGPGHFPLIKEKVEREGEPESSPRSLNCEFPSSH